MLPVQIDVLLPDRRVRDRDLGVEHVGRGVGDRRADPADHRLARSAASPAAALLLANPNVLYLQSTPMTEPLLFGTTMLAVTLVAEWVDQRRAALAARAPAWRSPRRA